MGICCQICKKKKISKAESQNENSTTTDLKDKQENIILPIQLSPKKNNNTLQNQYISNDIDHNSFPKGTEYEKELNANFKYFNVFWYDPNKSNDFDDFIKCFENVRFIKGYDLDSTINFFKTESISEWIVITPGSKGEELILNLQNFQCIKLFFIYCKNTKFHEKWATKIKKVGCLTSDPEILCQKFIEINKNYIIPKLNYKSEESISSSLNEISSENSLYSDSSKFKFILKAINKEKNKYYSFCIKTLNYLNSDEIENDFNETIEDNSPLYLGTKILQELKSENSSNIQNTIYLISYTTFNFIITIF